MAIQRMKMMIQMLMTRKSKYSVTIIALPYRLGYTENAFAYLNQEFFYRIECDEARDDEESDTNMEDLPVQGPLPQDPDDAPFRKSESGGIRKL